MKISEVHKDDRRTISLLSGLIEEDKEFTIIHLNKGKAIGGCVHKEREFMCVIDGSVFVTIGQVQEFLISGDGRCICAKKPHMFVAQEDSIIIEWGVSPEDKGKYNKEMRDEVNKINGKT